MIVFQSKIGRSNFSFPLLLVCPPLSSDLLIFNNSNNKEADGEICDGFAPVEMGMSTVPARTGQIPGWLEAWLPGKC